jgi:hypothetical protein
VGDYRTALSISTPGDYPIDLVEERAKSNFPFPPVGYPLLYDPGVETPFNHLNTPLLAKLPHDWGDAPFIDRSLAASVGLREGALGPHDYRNRCL